MNVLKTNISWQAEILTLLNEHKKPMQLRDFRSCLCKKFNIEFDKKKGRTLSVVLSSMVEQGKIGKVKVPDYTAFYAKPEWVFRGNFKKELGFDIHERQFKNPC